MMKSKVVDCRWLPGPDSNSDQPVNSPVIDELAGLP
jgi:hypothetical protein